MEPFPFNLDEFVTVDEVGDEAEERRPSRSRSSKLKMSDNNPQSSKTSTSERKSSAADSSKKFKKPPAVATLEARTSGDTKAKDKEVICMMENEPKNSVSVTKKKEAAKLEDVAVTPDVFHKAGHQTVFSKMEKKETLTPEPSESKEKDEECIAKADYKKASLINEETEKEANRLDSSALALKDEPHQVSVTQKSTSPAGHQSEMSEPALHKIENKEAPSQGALVTLDAVGGEDGDLADEADEEELLKRQAGENPEALLTVDEVGGDEAEVEKEQLEKALQGLVTLDEIVEEDDAGSFNPEVGIFTLLNLSWFWNDSII